MTQIEAVVFDIGNVLIEWQPEQFYDAQFGITRVHPSQLLFVDDREENITTAVARGWHGHQFKDAIGWAKCLVHHELLTAEQAELES